MKPRDIIHSMHIFNRIHRSCIQQIMESEGLFYGQLPILEAVKEKGCCTQKELVQILGVTAPSIATSIKRLVKKGYLSKKIDEKDQRNTLITITPAGNLKTQACRKKFDELDERVFEVLNAEEKETLVLLIAKLNDSIKKENVHD